MQQLEENVLACKTFTPVTKQEITTLLDLTKKSEIGSKVEWCK